MKNLILIGIVALITMSACGDREKDPLLSRTFTNATVPANSNPIWIQKTDSSFLLQLPVDTTFDDVADINVLIELETTILQPASSIVLSILFHRNKKHSFGNMILERKLSGVYLRKIN